MLTSNIRLRENCDLSDFECVIVGARRADVFLKLLISWDFLAQKSLVFTQNNGKNKKKVGGQQFCERNLLFDENRMARLVRIDRIDKGFANSLSTTEINRKASLNAPHVKPWGRWATTAENHVGL